MRLNLPGLVPTSAVMPSTTARLDRSASRTRDTSTDSWLSSPASCKNERKTWKTTSASVSPRIPLRRNSGNAAHQPLAHLLEVVHGPGLREEPLTVAERMRVLRPQRAHRRVPHVADQQVGPDIGRQIGHVELWPLVDWTAPDEHLAPLIEAEAPSERARRSIARAALRIRTRGLATLGPGDFR